MPCTCVAKLASSSMIPHVSVAPLSSVIFLLLQRRTSCTEPNEIMEKGPSPFLYTILVPLFVYTCASVQLVAIITIAFTNHAWLVQCLRRFLHTHYSLCDLILWFACVSTLVVNCSGLNRADIPGWSDSEWFKLGLVLVCTTMGD